MSHFWDHQLQVVVHFLDRNLQQTLHIDNRKQTQLKAGLKIRIISEEK